MEKNKIVFIIPYIGKYPWYFPYFLKSCVYNPDIDFKILSNADIPLSVKPNNVELIPYSLEKFNEDATKALGFDVNVEKAYKLCDFKPAYGYIFSDLIKGCDFWGYCDIDVIFGNIRSFMTEELLNEFDVISARHDYLTGCFALYRNNQNMLELFKQSRDYQKVFTQSRNFFFDETNFAFDEFEKGLHYSQIHTEVESMTHVVRRLQENSTLKAYFEFQIVEGFGGNMLWDKGTLIYRNEFEILLYHLVRFKREYSQSTDLQEQIPDTFRIETNKIY